MQIKRLEKKDIKLYENVLKDYIEQLMAPYTENEIKIEVERIYSNMCRFTEDETAIIIGALEKESLVGFIWGYKKIEEPSIIHINYFFINENYRSNGIGSKLLKELESKVKGCKELELLVNKNNTRALNFYKKNGFEIEETKTVDFKLSKRILINLK